MLTRTAAMLSKRGLAKAARAAGAARKAYGPRWGDAARWTLSAVLALTMMAGLEWGARRQALRGEPPRALSLEWVQLAPVPSSTSPAAPRTPLTAQAESTGPSAPVEPSEPPVPPVPPAPAEPVTAPAEQGPPSQAIEPPAEGAPPQAPVPLPAEVLPHGAAPALPEPVDDMSQRARQESAPPREPGPPPLPTTPERVARLAALSQRRPAVGTAAVRTAAVRTVAVRTTDDSTADDSTADDSTAAGPAPAQLSTAMAAGLAGTVDATPPLVSQRSLDPGFRLALPVQPRYPDAARRLERPGTVQLELEVAADGSVRAVAVQEEPPGWGFGAAAREAYAVAHFTPPTVNGAPVRVRWRKTLHFRP